MLADTATKDAPAGRVWSCHAFHCTFLQRNAHQEVELRATVVRLARSFATVVVEIGGRGTVDREVCFRATLAFDAQAAAGASSASS